MCCIAKIEIYYLNFNKVLLLFLLLLILTKFIIVSKVEEELYLDKTCSILQLQLFVRLADKAMVDTEL